VDRIRVRVVSERWIAGPHPDNAGSIKGFEAFRKLAEQLFMNPAFKAIKSDFKDLRIDLSRSGECAW
jgi:hypothetical protein